MPFPRQLCAFRPHAKLSKQTYKCDNEKIAINPSAWVLGILKARQFRPRRAKTSFPQRTSSETKHKYFLRLLPHLVGWVQFSHFHACSKGEIYNPRAQCTQCALFNMLRPETLFEARTKFTHKTNPKKGLSRFWHFYPLKNNATRPDNAPIWFMTLYIGEI